MSHFTCSAWIQYSFVDEALASTVCAGRSAAGGAGGGDLRRHLETLVEGRDGDFLVRLELLAGERAEEEPTGRLGDERSPTDRWKAHLSDHRRHPYLLTMTVTFITVGWIVQMKL